MVGSSSACGYNSLFKGTWKFRIVLGVTQSSIRKPALKSRLAQELHKESVSWHCSRMSWVLSPRDVPGPTLTVVQDKQWQLSSAHKQLGSWIKAKHFPRKMLQKNEYSVFTLSFLGCAWLILAWSKPWAPCCMAIALRWKTKSSFTQTSLFYLGRFELFAEKEIWSCCWVSQWAACFTQALPVLK